LSDKSLTDTLTLTNDTKDDLINQSTSSNSPISSNDSSDCLTESEPATSEHVYDNQLLNTKMPTDLPNLHATSNGNSSVLSFQVEIDDFVKQKIDEKLKECGTGDSDSDSEVQVYTPKGVDLPSAQRLAKRLYYLDGFKPSDVVRHLSKK
jgi:PH/SEC7 domain-containing protein